MAPPISLLASGWESCAVQFCRWMADLNASSAPPPPSALLLVANDEAPAPQRVIAGEPVPRGPARPKPYPCPEAAVRRAWGSRPV